MNMFIYFLVYTAPIIVEIGLDLWWILPVSFFFVQDDLHLFEQIDRSSGRQYNAKDAAGCFASLGRRRVVLSQISQSRPNYSHPEVDRIWNVPTKNAINWECFCYDHILSTPGWLYILRYFLLLSQAGIVTCMGQNMIPTHYGHGSI